MNKQKTTLLSRSAFILICSLIVWPPLLRGSVHEWHQGLIQIVTLLTALALMMERYLFSQHRIPWVQTPWNQPIIALLGLMIISTVTSLHTGLASAARIAGPYGNPNHLAGFIEMALPMVLILFLGVGSNIGHGEVGAHACLLP